MAPLDRGARRLPERRTGTESLKFHDCPLQALLQRLGRKLISMLALEALASGKCHAAALAQPLIGRAGHVIALAQLGPEPVLPTSFITGCQ